MQTSRRSRPLMSGRRRHEARAHAALDFRPDEPAVRGRGHLRRRRDAVFAAPRGRAVDEIAVMEAIAFLPAAYQLFWAPILDLAIRRRTWLVLCATSGSLFLGATLLLKLPDQLLAYEILIVIGQALVGLVASCNGALVATTVDPRLHGRAAGWVNAANLGASVLGGGLVLTLATKVSFVAAALALVFAISLPSLAAFSIGEAPPAAERLGLHLGQVARQVWAAIRLRRGWT